MNHVLAKSLGLALLLVAAAAPGQAARYERLHGLFSIGSDGRGLRLERAIAGTNLDKLHLSPDGRHVAFLRCTSDPDGDGECAEGEYTVKEVVLADRDGGHERIIGKMEGGFNDYPTWSPDGGSVLYMHSSAPFIGRADLWRYDLATRAASNVTNTPDWMESDHFWNADDTITVVRQRLVGGRPQEPNELAQFPLADPSRVTVLSRFPRSLGHHCCAADPKYAPGGGMLAFAHFAARRDGHDDWDVVLRGPDGGQENLSPGDTTDLWPMWRPDGKQLLWVRYDGRLHVQGVMVRDVASGATHEVRLVGDKVIFKIGDRPIVFARLNWPTWDPLNPGRMVFPATYLR